MHEEEEHEDDHALSMPACMGLTCAGLGLCAALAVVGFLYVPGTAGVGMGIAMACLAVVWAACIVPNLGPVIARACPSCAAYGRANGKQKEERHRLLPS